MWSSWCHCHPIISCFIKIQHWFDLSGAGLPGKEAVERVFTQCRLYTVEWMMYTTTPHHHSHFTALFPGPPGWAGARRELQDFMVQGSINRGRNTDHPAGRHSIRTNHCPPPQSPPHFLQDGCPSFRPTNSAKALKALIEWCTAVENDQALIVLNAKSRGFGWVQK